MQSTQPPWEVKRELLVKAEEEADPKYGCIPEERPAEEYINHGMVNLDKTAGPSSHEVTAWVKRLLGVKNAGHGGTLEAA
jgi:H/ACA ribonucleoprotein complex subunit 4